METYRAKSLGLHKSHTCRPYNSSKRSGKSVFIELVEGKAEMMGLIAGPEEIVRLSLKEFWDDKISTVSQCVDKN